MPYTPEEKKEIALYEEELKEQWNRSLLQHIKSVRAIKKPSPQFPSTIEKACEEYFDLCEDDGVKPSVAGLSVALGVSRDTLLSWVRGEVSIESADVIKTYFSLIEIFDETALKDNRTNAVSGIFMMKNNHGYKDQVEHKIVDDREISNEEIEMRYRQMHNIIEAEVVEKETPKVIEAPKEKEPIAIPTKTKPKKKKVDIPF